MLLLGMIVLGLATFAAMLAFVDAVRSGVGTAMTVLVAAAERRRVRLPGLRDAAPGEVLRPPWAPNTSPSSSRSCVTIATSVPLGQYMVSVFTGQRTCSIPCFVPIERLVLRVTGVDPTAGAGLEAVLVVAARLERGDVAGRRSRSSRCRQCCRSIPTASPTWSRRWPSTRSRASSTNTNLQHYSGETGLSYFSQMFVITFLQFVTAATGMAACVAMIRGAGRQPAGDARQLLRRLHAGDACACCCRWRSSWRIC